jgi:hypothetical protein
VLADFLRSRQPIADPVERSGEVVVIGAAARVIARLREERAYQLLSELAVRWPVTGVLAGLGSFHRKESIATYIGALGEDELRLTAETILYGYGKAVRPAITAVALNRGNHDRPEGESHLRKRRNALGLLSRLGLRQRNGQVFGPCWRTLTPRPFSWPAGSALTWVLERTGRRLPRACWI